MSVLTHLYLAGALFWIGYVLARVLASPGRMAGDGYLLVLAAFCWPALMVVGLYVRLSNWVRRDLDNGCWA